MCVIDNTCSDARVWIAELAYLLGGLSESYGRWCCAGVAAA
jgi:hypothetical protein